MSTDFHSCLGGRSSREVSLFHQKLCKNGKNGKKSIKHFNENPDRGRFELHFSLIHKKNSSFRTLQFLEPLRHHFINTRAAPISTTIKNVNFQKVFKDSILGRNFQRLFRKKYLKKTFKNFVKFLF